MFDLRAFWGNFIGRDVASGNNPTCGNTSIIMKKEGIIRPEGIGFFGL